MIYLDNNATTRLVPAVFDAMRPFLEGSYGNPSAAYSLSGEAFKAVGAAHESVANLLGAASPTEIAFNSGGTESDNWAIRGALEATGKRHIVISAIEHEAVSKLCDKLETENYRITRIAVDENGFLDLDELRSSLSDETAVVSVMMANNETGILLPVNEIAEIVKERSAALFHVDAVNAAGKIPIDLKSTAVDLLAVSAHKFHGPKGIGALYIRDGVKLPSLMIGGGQQRGRRAGTEAVHQIAGMGAAAEFVMDLSAMEQVRELRDRLESALLSRIPNAFLNGTNDAANRLPNTSSISFENINGEMIMHRLDERDICVSTGSACNSKGHRASAVLAAMNVPYSRAMGSVRFSLGRFNTESEVDLVIDALTEITGELRSIANIG